MSQVSLNNYIIGSYCRKKLADMKEELWHLHPDNNLPRYFTTREEYSDMVVKYELYLYEINKFKQLVSSKYI